MTANCEGSLSGHTVLVTGATGFIGTHTCAHLTASGATVRRATRKEEGSDTFAVGDIDADTDWSYALGGVDAIVHLAARVHAENDPSPDPFAEYSRVNVAGTRRLAGAAAEAGVRRMVLLSSTSVTGQESPDALDETAPAEPKTPYARSKLDAEQALFEVASATRLQPVIVRAPPVYGPGNPGKLSRLIRLVNTGLPLPLGAARTPRSFLYVGNLVDLLALCVSHPAAPGELFLASDGEDMTTADLVRLIGAVMGRRVTVVPVPRSLLTLGARVLGRSADVAPLFAARTVDSGKARRLLLWAPPHTVEEGLAVTINSVAQR